MSVQQRTDRWRGLYIFLIGFLAIFTLIAFLGVWGTRTQISGAVIARGMVMVESNRQVVQHPEGGVIAEIFVRNGDVVAKDDILVELDNSDIQSEIVINERQLVEDMARLARLRAERDGEAEFTVDTDQFDQVSVEDNADIVSDQRKIFDARRVSLNKELGQVDEQIHQTQEQVAGLEAQIEAIQAQLEIADAELATSRNLNSKKLLVNSKLREQLQSNEKLKGELASLQAQRSQNLSSIAALELSKTRLENERREKAITELRDLDKEYGQLLEKHSILERQLARSEIRAPMGGVVYGSNVFAIHSVVEKAKPIMYIVPQDQTLIVAVRIPAADIDQVAVGQDVNLRFTALDRKFTPEVKGTVKTISADSLTDQSSGKSFYEAEILPLESELGNLGEEEIVPGMPVEAYIQTYARSPLNYLTKPLTDYFNRAFRSG